MQYVYESKKRFWTIHFQKVPSWLHFVPSQIDLTLTKLSKGLFGTCCPSSFVKIRSAKVVSEKTPNMRKVTVTDWWRVIKLRLTCGKTNLKSKFPTMTLTLLSNSVWMRPLIFKYRVVYELFAMQSYVSAYFYEITEINETYSSLLIYAYHKFLV